MPFQACGLILGLLASLFGYYALWFRADSYEELVLGRQADAVVGVLFAVAFLPTRVPAPPAGRRGWAVRTALGAALIWVGTGGVLMVFHAGVARARFASPQVLSLNRLKMAHLAVSDYLRDCGAPPSESQGLESLYQNPGVRGWSGPYLPPDALIDGWGWALRYGIRDGRLCIWSCGPDGQSGSDDDIVISAQD